MADRRARAHPPLRVRPLRVAVFVASLGLTLATALIAVGGMVAGAPPVRAASVSSADPRDAEPPAPVDPQLPPGFSVTGAVTRLSAGLEAAVQRALALEPPPRSGTGRRVVFDESAQQVWLVRDDESVHATYPVSGSVHDNLEPGTYAVYSRAREAVGFDYRSSMEYMVRFTQGDTAAIGFHDIPVDDQGRPVQSVTELGTPTSSGCIRQRERDALLLWRFAPVGTTVTVVA
ncbi:MAG: L,D-transpeptidase family protein [Actinomycetota bacterium]|nr:L,D-transpeptidase family protein [Actinomycetota bacterium]